MERLARFTIVVSVLLSSIAQSAFSQDGEQRLWTDGSGKFQVRAALIEQTDSAARLRTADGREITVPLERLSQADQDYLKSLSVPADNPFAGGTPMREGAVAAAAPAITDAPATLREGSESKSVGEEMALPGTGTTLDLSAAPSDEPFTPDPQPAAAALPAAAVALASIDPYDKVSMPVPARVAEGGFLVSIGRNKSGSPQETRGRIYSVNAASKKSELVWDHPRAVSVLDYDPSSRRTLLVDKLDQSQRGGELVMVQDLETGNGKPLYRRILPGAGQPGFEPQVEWARLLSGSHAAAIVNGVLYVWDLPAAKLLYRVERIRAGEPPVFSGNQCYMAVPQSGKAVIVETATGKVRKSLEIGSTLTPGVAFHPDGRLLATCFMNQYRVWDCVENKVVSEATTTDHLGSHPIHWIGPRLFLAASGDAVHLDLGMSVWRYRVSLATEPIVVGKTLVTATTSDNCVLTSVMIPNSSAEKSIDRLMRAGDAAMLVRPGESVAIAVEASAPVDQVEIKQSLAEAAEKAGWKVNSRAPITLVAKIGRGKTQQLQFRSMEIGDQTVSSAQLTPFTAELEIRRGTTVLWTRSTTNRIPFMFHLQQGETVQDAVKRYEKPDAGFFARLDLPPRIPKPEITEQVGDSVLKDGAWRDY